ncbi:MAG: guanylate kinase [Bacteroidales bacterium]|nr:guanylate kinase [Bacteroidales bacterium]
MSGKLVIFSAPSGAGKTTIVRNVLREELALEFSVSATSRKRRDNETNGRDYYFMSPDAFRNSILNGEFIEWEEVYPDHLYGTLRNEIERIWETGKSVIFDLDVAGGLNLKKMFGNRALAIFVMPPSPAELERRLRARGTESEEKIALRIDKAEKEISRAGEFDYIIVNEDIEDATSESVRLVNKFLSQTEKDGIAETENQQ